MKVEKISENKVKITLTLDELELRDISLKDIENNSSLARELFIDLLEETNLADEFAESDTQLFIEASSDNENLFVVTITKIDNIPELKKYSTMKKSTSKNSSKKEKITSSIYSFDGIDGLLLLCDELSKNKVFLGKNSLYKYDNTYFVIFNDTTIQNKNFYKTFSIISEFCSEYYSYEMFNTYVKEKSQLVIANFALQKLINNLIKNTNK